MTTFQKRAFRFWLVLLLPLSLFFAYKAYYSHNEMKLYKGVAAIYRERMLNYNESDDNSLSFIALQAAYNQQSELSENFRMHRLAYSFLALVLLSTPLAIHVSGWVWNGSDKPPS